MKRLSKAIYLLPALLFFTLSGRASTLDLYLSGGANFSDLHNVTAVPVSSSQVNNYVAHTTTQTKLTGGFGIGQTFNNVGITPLDISIGLMGYYNDFGYVKGKEYPFANMSSTNTLTYRFDAASYALLAELRIAYSDSRFQPYILAGAGSSWNRISNYKQSPTNPASSATAMHTFTNHTNNDFAYEAGAGIQYLLPFSYSYGNNAVYYSLDLGYRFLDLGKGESGQISGQSSGDRLTVAHMRTQAALLTLQASL